MRHTRTYANLEVSAPTLNEIRRLMTEAGYPSEDDGSVLMDSIALIPRPPRPVYTPPNGQQPPTGERFTFQIHDEFMGPGREDYSVTGSSDGRYICCDSGGKLPLSLVVSWALPADESP
jgi:hypothetical protein